MIISVAARASPLSQVQTEEVLNALPHGTLFQPHFVQSHGDIDLVTSLRTLDKTDFFTREIDEMLLKGICRIAIHSAKDLPELIRPGLQVIAITQGLDPSDSLVMREYETIETLNPGSLIATSSIRREEAVKGLRSDLKYRDLRGTIHARLELLSKGEADGVVIAEAALLRLNLAHLNRIRLPGKTTPLQGQLAIISRENDTEMQDLFHCLDSRHMEKALYIGPEFPRLAFPKRRIIHHPLIQIIPRDTCDALADWHCYTHLILTSKTAVKILASHLRRAKISPKTLKSKVVIAVGQATAETIQAFGATPLIAEVETAEGVVEILKQIPFHHAHFFWPHAALSRPLIEKVLKEKGACYTSCILYDTETIADPQLPCLSDFQEILFSSPTTVSAFFASVPKPPAHLKFTSIGPITEKALTKALLD